MQIYDLNMTEVSSHSNKETPMKFAARVYFIASINRDEGLADQPLGPGCNRGLEHVGGALDPQLVGRSHICYAERTILGQRGEQLQDMGWRGLAHGMHQLGCIERVCNDTCLIS